MDIFSTFILNKTVENLKVSSSFLLDSFFSTIQTEESEEIHFDIDKSKPRLAPFVSPLVAGKVVANEGFETKSFKPAYIKDKRRFDPNQPLKRRIGEKIGGSLTAMQRKEALLNRALRNQLENLTRREEVMASEILRTGKVTVTGDDYPTQIVDFKRDEALTLNLTTGNKWGDSGVKPIDDIEDWACLVQEKSGASATSVVMDPKAWRIFKNTDEVQKFLEYRRGTNNTINIDPNIGGQGNLKARYVGSIGCFDFFVYNDVYTDDDGVTKSLLPDFTVMVLSSESLDGVRCYGAIQDEEAGYKAVRYHTKSWLEKDPAVRWLLLQSAPLLVPYRPNASFCATIK